MRTGWSLRQIAFLVAGASLAFGQAGTGTITGTVTDPAGAVVPGAAVEAKNTDTGVAFPAESTSTGDYTISQLPIGTYVVTVKVQGFKTYTHTNLALSATQVMKEDVVLQVGNAADSVTVTEEATLLKTETGELSHNVTLTQMDNLPLLGVGLAGNGPNAIRNPFNVVLSLPGSAGYTLPGYNLGNFNGQTTQASIRIEGQDATPHALAYEAMAQPGVDAIQEVAFQTSNYAPEFGTTGSVLMNFQMKSGTNQYHGSGYDYFVNEDLNAGNPYSVNTSGMGKVRPKARRNDFGGTLGGPIYVPKVYNGHNKSFFFFNYEEYLETSLLTNTDTVPAPAYLRGDFSAISPNGTCSLCVPLGIQQAPLGGTQLDPAGNKLYANEIYDPLTRAVATSGSLAGQGYALPFQGNIIPANRFDPVTVNFLNLLNTLGVKAQSSNVTGNYLGTVPSNRYSVIPSVKLDHNVSSKDKLSFYYQETNVENQVSVGAPQGADGLPLEIGGYRGNFFGGRIERLNYDRSLTPTLLLHVGAGYYYTTFTDRAAFLSFDPAAFGLTGFVQHRQFPSITGMSSAVYGGMQNMGTNAQIQSIYHDDKPSYNANATWVHGKHTYKLGGEVYFQGAPIQYYAGVTLATGTNATSAPFTPANSLNGYTTGFGFASWLLGDYGTTTNGVLSSTNQAAPYDYRMGYQQWGLFLQDSWKVTRKLTLDYGLRWDLATSPHETYGRLGQLDMTTPNANAGGRPGATRYANTCGCQFYQPSYPYAIGPRIGVAYQFDPKTVLRGGWGVVYTEVFGTAGGIVSTNGTYPVTANSPSYIPLAAQFVNIEVPGSIQTPAWPVTDPNRFPLLGTLTGAPTYPDANQNRPPRANQFSIGVQREITRSFVMEAAYVGNRVAWLSGPLGNLSRLSPQQYASYGLFPYPGTGPAGYANNNNDRNLLSQSISSPAVTQNESKFGITNLLPYPGFPTSSALQSVMYPFPQFGALNPSGSATGNSKYDSLQLKATKRFSHGLQASGAFTWAKGFTRATRQDFFNPASSAWALQQIPPRALTLNFVYTTPKAAFLPKYANLIVKDWQIGGYALYQSGAFLTPPASTQFANFLSSEDTRVAGQPLYNVDLNNIHSYNPATQQVLNPAAWAACPTNTTCTAPGTLYSDFRGLRAPSENANVGRNFRIKERMNFQIRAEFVNIFNRTLMPNPSTANPQNNVTKTAGINTAGFGVINTFATPGSQPTAAVAPYLTGRTGTVIARFTF